MASVLLKFAAAWRAVQVVCCINSMHAHPVLDHGPHELYMPPFSRHIHHWCLIRAASKAIIRAGSQESYVVWHPSGQRQNRQKIKCTSLSNASMSAPFSNNSCTISVSPRLAATWRGVRPYFSVALTVSACTGLVYAVQFRSELLPSPASVRGLCCTCPRQAQVELSAKPSTALMGILNTSKMRCNVCTSAPRSASRPLV